MLFGGTWSFYKYMLWRHEYDIDRRIQRYNDIIERQCRINALPYALVYSIIRAESGGQELAVSPAQAKGLMQITPITEQEILRRNGTQKGNLFDPQYNISVGTGYLRILLDRFGNDQTLAVAAYHMGPTRLEQLRQAHADLSSAELINQFANPVTLNYVLKVIGWYEKNSIPAR